jgi:DNA repair ATPase RecN
MREKYMNIAGAHKVLQEGRKESQRLIMDRYKRDQAQALRKVDPSYNNLDMYRQNSNYKVRDPYRQYIPMS